MSINLKQHKGSEAIPHHVGQPPPPEQIAAEIVQNHACWPHNWSFTESLVARLQKAEAERDGIIANIGPCGACAEGLLCGSISHTHSETCVYSKLEQAEQRLSDGAKLIKTASEVLGNNLESDKRAEKAERERDEALEGLRSLHSDSTANDFNEHWDSYVRAAEIIAKHEKK